MSGNAPRTNHPWIILLSLGVILTTVPRTHADIFSNFNSGVATLLPTTYTWSVPSGSWTTAGNWTPVRTTPATDDILVFDGATTPSAAVTNVPIQTIGQLRVTGGAAVTLTPTSGINLTIGGGDGDDFVVASGSALAVTATNFNALRIALLAGATGSVSGELTFAGGAHRVLPTDAGSLVFEAGSNCRTLTGFLGSLFDNTGTNDVVRFRSGSTYHHGAGNHPFGPVAPDSRIVAETGSLIRYLANPANGAFNGRTYGNCEFNTVPAITIVGPISSVCSIDNLTVISGGFRPGTVPWAMNIRGNLTVSAGGTFDLNPPSGPCVLSFTAAGPQTIHLTGPDVRLGAFSTLDVVNPTGLTLGRYLFSDGTVSLSGGKLFTGSHMMHLGQLGTVVGPHWVVGNLGRIIPGSAGTVTRNFEVGDAARAAGLTISFASVGDSGTVLVRTDPGDHPDLATSGLDPNQSVNRTWAADDLGVGFTSYDITLAFDSADLDAGTDPNLLRVAKREGGVWSLPTVGARTATSTQATALFSLSDFAVAKTTDGVDVDPIAPASTSLSAPQPTPFEVSTVLEYGLARAGRVELVVYGVDGRRVRTLERGNRIAGIHRLTWDGRDDRGRAVAAGVYLAQLATGDGRFHRRLIKVR